MGRVQPGQGLARPGLSVFFPLLPHKGREQRILRQLLGKQVKVFPAAAVTCSVSSGLKQGVKPPALPGQGLLFDGVARLPQPFPQPVAAGHGLQHQPVPALPGPGGLFQDGGDHLAPHAADDDGVGVLRTKGLQPGAEHGLHPVLHAAGPDVRPGRRQWTRADVRGIRPLRAPFRQRQAKIGVVAAHIDDAAAPPAQLRRQSQSRRQFHRIHPFPAYK